MAIVIAGTGSYVPERVLTNADLERMVETSDEWITSRTGIKERRIASEDQASSDLAVEAAKRALDDAGISPEDVDYIFVGTCTPDKVFPSTACLVQDQIGATNAVCMDVAAVCSGFIYGLEVARRMLKGGDETIALVIGAEKMSSVIDWTDRNTCVLFGDGAGAAVLKKTDGEGGLGPAILGSNGKLNDLLHIPAGGSRQPVNAEVLADKSNTLRMTGTEVFKHAVTNMTRTADRLLHQEGWGPDDLALVVPHQANQRIIAAIRTKLKFPEDRIFINVEKYGNTSAASIGIALDEAVKSGRVKPGDKVMLIAFGAGFTWGGIMMEWSK